MSRPAAEVILLTDMFPPAVGGSAVLFAHLYSRLGLPVRVFTNARPAAPSGFVYEPGIDIDSTRRGLREPGAVRQHLLLARRLRARAPGVVHCGRALPEGLPAMIAAAATRGLTFVAWVHGEEINSARQSREHALMMRAVHSRARLLLANSRNTRDELARNGVDPAKVRIIYPGVAPSRFDCADGIRPAAGPIVLTVGRLQRRKGHDTMLQALALVRHRHPTVHYVVVGDGEERARLHQMARDLGLLDGAVTFVGEVPEDALPRYFAGCDVFAMPNRVEAGDFEGFGIVFLEAAAAGKPTIGGRSGGVPEAIADGQTGLLVSGDDVPQLASALDRLLSDADLRLRMGRAGQERVRREFSWQRSADALLAAHHEAAGSGAGLTDAS